MTRDRLNDFEKEVTDIIVKYLENGSMTVGDVIDSLTILTVAVKIEMG